MRSIPTSNKLNRQDAKNAKHMELDEIQVTIEPSKALDALANRVIGAAIEVHRHLGPGYLESVYEQALVVELTRQGIRVQQQSEISVEYKGVRVGQGRLDLIVENELIVELKSVEALLPLHKAQVISYLKMTGLRLGLLINFNSALLRQGIQRVIYSGQ